MYITKANNGDVIMLENYVDITDPCYSMFDYGNFTLPCKPGEYVCYFEKKDFDDYSMISKCAIIHSDYNDGLTQNHVDLDFSEVGFNNNLKVKPCYIGVDAGLAGFFNNKPDFDDDKWMEFCSYLQNIDAALFESDDCEDGFFTSSGYGDGGYEVTCLLDEDKFVAGVIDFEV